MDLEFAPDIQKEITRLVDSHSIAYIDSKRIVAFRSYGSKSKARARIWSLPKIWQLALKIPSYYCIEVISHHFDHLSVDKKRQILLHELAHIPGNFSGALLPHGRMKKFR